MKSEEQETKRWEDGERETDKRHTHVRGKMYRDTAGESVRARGVRRENRQEVKKGREEKDQKKCRDDEPAGTRSWK